MGNEISDRKNKAKAEASRNCPDGEAIKKEEEDQTGSFNRCLTFSSLFVCLEKIAFR